METEKTTIKIKLKPSNKNWNCPGISAYHFIDMNLRKGTGFYTFLFGNEQAEKLVRQGIWETAYVKLDKVEMLIPFSRLIEDSEKSCLFNAFEGSEIHLLSKGDAVRMATYFFLCNVINYASQNGFCNRFVNEYGEEYLTKLCSTYKYELFADEIIGRVAYKLLD